MSPIIKTNPTSPNKYFIFGGVILSLVMIASFGFLAFNRFVVLSEAQTEKSLQDVAIGKSKRIQHFLKERYGNAQLLSQNSTVWKSLQSAAKKPRAIAVDPHFDRLLAQTASAYHYRRVMVLDSSLHPIGRNSKSPLSPVVLAALHDAIANRRPSLIDIHLTDNDIAVFGVAHPVFMKGKPGGNILGVVYLEDDVREHLNPIFAQGPSQSSNAGSFLARREGNDVVYLTPLHFAPYTKPLSIRSPIRDSQYLDLSTPIPSSGRPIDGMDYYGVHVIGAIVPVTGTDWFLVVNTNHDAASSSVQTFGFNILLFVTLFSIVPLAGGWMLWQAKQEEISSRIKAESAIRARDEQLKDFLTSAPDPMLIVDRNGLIQDANQKVEQFFGYARNKLMGQPIEMLMPQRFRSVHPAHVAEFNRMATAQRIGSQCITTQRKVSALTRNGREIPVEAALSTLQTSHGMVTVASVRDITDQITYEKKLRQNEQRLLDILNSSPIGVRIAKKHGNEIVFCNKRYKEFVRVPEVVDLALKQHYADPTIYDEILAELALGGQIINRQIQLKSSDGVEKWVLASYMSMKFQGKDTVLGWFFDISERLKMQESLRLALEEQQTIFDTATSGIVFLKDCIILRCNRRMLEMLGYSAEEQIGKNTRMWYTDDIAYETISREYYAQITYKQVVTKEIEMVRKMGSKFWARISSNPIDWSHPELGSVSIIEDITQEREATQALLKAKQLAEEAAQMKADFLATMSHEIRTPINAVIGLSHLMLKTELTAHQQDCITKIQTSGQHLLGIVNDVLDFSKIEAGRMNLEHIDFDLDKILDDLAGLIQEKASEKGLEIIFDVAPEIPKMLVGDPLRLGQVLINLCSNAIKFTEKGEVEISAHKLDETDDRVKLRFAVKDTGIGITQEQIEKLFNSFQQGDSSITRKHGGTGLGLVISKRMVGLMGGEIGVNSEPDKGSEFWFVVHLEKSSIQRPNMKIHSNLRDRSVLVVNDNVHARMALAEQLSSMGFVTDAAEDGIAAIDMVKKASISKPYDAIFMDWQLPVMNGFETIRKIKALGITPVPKFILVTEYSHEEAFRSAQSTGIEEVLIKPLTPSTVFDSLSRVFGIEKRENRSSTNRTSALLMQEMKDIIGSRILLAEDNEINQQIVVELLTDAGFMVDIVKNGRKAIEQLYQQHYNLVLMDIQMPVMDGMTATSMIRKIPGFAQLPIIAMTANAIPQDRERCLAIGMNDYLVKPIEPENLFATLRRWITPHISQAKTVAAQATVNTNAPVPVNIDGLDTKLGLRRVLNERKFYVSMLQRFVDGQGKDAEQIRESLNNADDETAERLAHTLKGVAGNIGASALQNTAEQLETMIRDKEKRESLDAVLAELTAQLSGLTSQLRAWLILQA